MKIKEPPLSSVGLEIAKKRYLRTSLKGKVLETPGEMLWRVARHAAKAEINWAKNGEIAYAMELFYNKLTSLKFVCSGRAMYEAGNEEGTKQLSACFVLPIEDSISSIFKTLGEAALIHKNNGGTGFNFSKIRPHGDRVKNVAGASSGPVDFIKAYSAALEKILQGEKRNGANMAILNIDHPDVEEFIRLKDEDQTIRNFNLSLGISQEFMERVMAKKNWELKNPRNGQVVKKIKANKLFDTIARHAWATGDPGMMFLDRMESDNPTPSLGKLDATNPCGEQPLLPYESCNLSSIVLSRHLKKNKDKLEIDWEDLASTVAAAVHFLDNLIEVNEYVLPEIERTVKFGNRKIGLGVMGFAHLLYLLKISYASNQAVILAERLAKFIRREAEKESARLAKTRGTFPNFDLSIYAGSDEKYRNATLLTIAPTGTISLFANCSSGIEPVFALYSTRRVFYEDNRNNPGKELVILDPIFEEKLWELAKNQNWNEEKVKKITAQIKNEGGIDNVKELPDEMKKIFITTHAVPWEYHVKIQAAWQKYFDNAVSKTINFPNSASVEDVKKAYILAWKLGCKGITIYRDGSKKNQVLIKKTGENSSVCPECGSLLINEEGCSHCSNCGFAACKA